MTRPSARRRLTLCVAIGWAGTLLASCSSTPDSTPTVDGSCPANALAAPADTTNVECPNDLPTRDDCATTALTYRADTASLINQRCVGCHQSGTGNRHVFSSYAAVANAREAILAQVYACRMPPSCAPPLSASERVVLLKWLVCGAAEG